MEISTGFKECTSYYGDRRNIRKGRWVFKLVVCHPSLAEARVDVGRMSRPGSYIQLGLETLVVRTPPGRRLSPHSPLLGEYNHVCKLTKTIKNKSLFLNKMDLDLENWIFGNFVQFDLISCTIFTVWYKYSRGEAINAFACKQWTHGQWTHTPRHLHSGHTHTQKHTQTHTHTGFTTRSSR